jgi:hypothetical protein
MWHKICFSYLKGSETKPGGESFVLLLNTLHRGAAYG